MNKKPLSKLVEDALESAMVDQYETESHSLLVSEIEALEAKLEDTGERLERAGYEYKELEERLEAMERIISNELNALGTALEESELLDVAAAVRNSLIAIVSAIQQEEQGG